MEEKLLLVVVVLVEGENVAIGNICVLVYMELNKRKEVSQHL